MLQLKDRTGRFSTRPHFTQEELDSECEEIITSFLQKKNGEITYPITTNDLEIFLERDAAELDTFADLSDLGENVEGVTEFFPGQRPRVRISRFLKEDPRRENRFRTTLTHEYGHVHFHACLWELQAAQTNLFSPSHRNIDTMSCKRDNILTASSTDWMEWQAGYVCGSILMPKTYLRQLVTKFYTDHSVSSPPLPKSAFGLRLIENVAQKFQVSHEAAKVRLSQLKFLNNHDQGPSLLNG